MTVLIRSALVAVLLSVTLPSLAQLSLPDAIQSTPFRTDDERARDRYRHPAATLQFFGLKPDMTVVELSPGGQWYTNILAPYMSHWGTYIAADMHPELRTGLDEPAKRAESYAWTERFLTRRPARFGDNARASFYGGPYSTIEDGSVDMVVVFRSFHGWVYNDVVDPVLTDLFRMIKPGGTLGLVQHRDAEDSEYQATDRRGYVKPSFVIAAAKKAGFVLDASSEINANPKDRKDYEGGVWTLPPVLRYGEKDRDEYLAIGESDRMTLRFVKPAE